MNAQARQFDAVLQALSDQTRRLILDELRLRPEQTLFEICVRLTEKHHLNLTRQAISKHLNVLEAALLIRTTWKGRTKIHSLDSGPIRKLYRKWLGKYL